MRFLAQVDDSLAAVSQPPSRAQEAAYSAEVGGGGALLKRDSHPHDQIRSLDVLLHDVKHIVRSNAFI